MTVLIQTDSNCLNEKTKEELDPGNPPGKEICYSVPRHSSLSIENFVKFREISAASTAPLSCYQNLISVWRESVYIFRSDVTKKKILDQTETINLSVCISLIHFIKLNFQFWSHNWENWIQTVSNSQLPMYTWQKLLEIQNYFFVFSGYISWGASHHFIIITSSSLQLKC